MKTAGRDALLEVALSSDMESYRVFPPLPLGSYLTLQPKSASQPASHNPFAPPPPPLVTPPHSFVIVVVVVVGSFLTPNVRVR